MTEETGGIIWITSQSHRLESLWMWYDGLEYFRSRRSTLEEEVKRQRVSQRVQLFSTLIRFFLLRLQAIMIRQDYNRIDPKRRSTIDYKKKQFAIPTYKQQNYPHRLSLYEIPPTLEITLEQFEQWAIDRLRSIPDACSSIKSACLTAISSRRDWGVLLPQQNTCRDCGPFNTSTSKMVASSFQHVILRWLPRRESQARTAERSLLPLYLAACVLFNWGPAEAFLTDRECFVQITLPKRRRQRKTKLCRIIAAGVGGRFRRREENPGARFTKCDPGTKATGRRGRKLVQGRFWDRSGACGRPKSLPESW